MYEKEYPETVKEGKITANEYLEQIEKLSSKIDNKLAVLSVLECNIKNITPNMCGEIVSHSRNVYAQQELEAKIIDLKTEINADTDALADLRREAEEAIERIDDSACRTVLSLRYVWLNKWCDVAAAVPCYYRSVFRFRDKGLAALDKLIEEGMVKTRAVIVDDGPGE